MPTQDTPAFVPLTPEERAFVERLLQRATDRKERLRNSGSGVYDIDGNKVPWEAPARQLKGGGTRLYDRTTSSTPPQVQAVKLGGYKPWQPTPRPIGNIPRTIPFVMQTTDSGLQAALNPDDPQLPLPDLDLQILAICYNSPRPIYSLIQAISVVRNNPMFNPMRAIKRIPVLVEKQLLDITPNPLRHEPPSPHSPVRRSGKGRRR